MQRDKRCRSHSHVTLEQPRSQKPRAMGNRPRWVWVGGEDQASDCENVGSIKSVILQVTRRPIPRSSLHSRNDTRRKRKPNAVFAWGVNIPGATMDNAVCLLDQDPPSRDWRQPELTQGSTQSQ